MASLRRGLCCRCLSRLTGYSKRSDVRHFSSTGSRTADGVIDSAERPRWSYTPEMSRAPVSMHPKKNSRFQWKTNSDPELLDRVYVRLLGAGGAKLLSDEVKWLAMTHKSFDQGRRGYNDRLACFGRRIVTLQVSLALVNPARAGAKAADLPLDPHGRTPFTHPALEGLESLTPEAMFDVLDRKRLAALATRVGLTQVLRWLPKKPDNLAGSGVDTVLTEALYAVVGAVALQRGGDTAAKVTRERILAPLGVL